MEKFLESLLEAEKLISFAGHIVYVTLPVVQEDKLLLKVLSELKKGLVKCLNSLLQYEYIFKRIRLSNDPKINFEIFRDKCSARYQITPHEVGKVKEILELARSSDESAMQFPRGNKIVILSADMKPTQINLELIKEFLKVAESVLKKTKMHMKSD